MQNSLQDCSLNHFQFLMVQMQSMSGCVWLPSVCRIRRLPAATHCHSINEIGGSKIYFKAVGLHMDKIHAYVELLTGAGFYAILLNLLI